ncbi:2OG-Fe(II) oxygenase [Streptomyces shenzhenensis]|uniref:2OG-Fe(II) oxygenase n=1 Tax=Streptomyces shenzhenensis TaxID=943815 RepID=UPI001C68D73D|nr:2OG-Fe(II) oxygenase [Streptomyces shenzhenensis]
MQDTVTAATEETSERSLVNKDALWRLPVTVCRITDFLGEQTSNALLERAIATARSEMAASTIRDGAVVPTFRRSRSDGTFAVPELMSAIHEVLEVVEHTLGISCQGSEPSYGLNVHNDGDFYRAHQDVGPTEFASRRLLTFVYYLHRTPRPFQGGALRVFDIAMPLHTDGRQLTWQDRTWKDWEPQHDSIVFFRPTAWHEVRTVNCPSRRHEDSRFAINGWMCSPSGKDTAAQ